MYDLTFSHGWLPCVFIQPIYLSVLKKSYNLLQLKSLPIHLATVAQIHIYMITRLC